ncbi:MAG: DNA translocase FtsK 4TM domain-containing protein, partial [Gallionellaceae bacterium]|nr:DNA translocase FtsK 4TM domain-containing protein [Gallionellaceae bacterium]
MSGNVRRPPPATRKRKPLAPKVARLLREAWWIMAVGLALFLALILASYQPADPGWSSTGSADAIANTGGAFGAWTADLLLYLLGGSAWWSVALSLYLVWWGYRRIGDPDPVHQHGLFVTLGGFLVMLLASSGLEALR